MYNLSHSILLPYEACSDCLENGIKPDQTSAELEEQAGLGLHCSLCFSKSLHKNMHTRGVHYVMKTAQYIPKFYIYTLHNNFH